MNLPTLPRAAVYSPALGTVGVSMYTYTAAQMEEYATAAVLAERERCAQWCLRLMPNPALNLSDVQIVSALRNAYIAIRSQSGSEPTDVRG
jgi:hypothetical protein